MTSTLDQLLAEADNQQPAELDGLEDQVWARIRRHAPANTNAASWRLKAAMVSGALALGLAVGGATAAAAGQVGGEMSAFGTRINLAPSTLLEGIG
ncbi:hypothetical protein P7B02_01875 [Caulobacter segnis]|uniref:hypothetical protein n=1 Tax=Caulobacter segnis TaxID=88688 RepID=UPI00240F00DD|nr:hypothetical protein [Caulobacter segnis]MDG2520273.1 hypothetical protein [Caulobacter segnis]